MGSGWSSWTKRPRVATEDSRRADRSFLKNSSGKRSLLSRKQGDSEEGRRKTSTGEAHVGLGESGHQQTFQGWLGELCRREEDEGGEGTPPQRFPSPRAPPGPISRFPPSSSLVWPFISCPMADSLAKRKFLKGEGGSPMSIELSSLKHHC